MSIEIIISLIAALGVGGILGALLNRRFEQQKQTNDHDIKIFNQSNEILPEQKLVNVTNFQLLNFHSIAYEDFSLLKKWCDFFEWTGSKYLDKNIRKENQKLLDDLSLLVKYIGKNFEILSGVNPNDSNLYLKPDLDPDRAWNPDGEDVTNPDQAARYQEYAKELEGLTKIIKKQYSSYRLAIKTKLKI
jgi:hypothetical protein